MRVGWQVDGASWLLDLQLHPEDPVSGPGQGNSSVSLLARRARIQLPGAVTEPHPDAEALAAFVIVRPWIARRLVVRRAVSRQFADLVHRLFRIDVAPVDDALTPRRPGRRPLLAYSAGVDSVAASELLPDDTPHIHHRRVPHPLVPNRATSWRADAIEHLVQKAGRRGRDVHVVRADFEYLVHPYPSLPHWFGFAVGPLLMSDHLDGGAIALGGTLETFYMDMGRRWLGDREGVGGLDGLPAMMGLPLMRPVLGVTEIGTMRLAMESDLADLARSCTVGSFAAPCGRCAKCIRKNLITAAISQGPAPAVSAADLQRIKAAQPPIYMQAQYEYALARVDAVGAMADLRGRLNPDPAETSWMERCYPPSVPRAVPEPWREGVGRNIEARLGWMSEQDVAVARAWNRG